MRDLTLIKQCLHYYNENKVKPQNDDISSTMTLYVNNIKVKFQYFLSKRAGVKYGYITIDGYNLVFNDQEIIILLDDGAHIVKIDKVLDDESYFQQSTIYNFGVLELYDIQTLKKIYNEWNL